MALPFDDDFEGYSNGTLASNSDWADGTDGEQGSWDIEDAPVSSNKVADQDATGDVYSWTYWTTDTPDNDQYVEYEVVDVGNMGDGSDYASGGGIRMATDAPEGYAFGVTKSYRDVRSWSGGWYSAIGSTSGAPTADEALSLEVSGTTLTAKKGGSVDTAVMTSGTATNSDHSSGRIGLAGYTHREIYISVCRGGNGAAGGAATNPQPIYPKIANVLGMGHNRSVFGPRMFWDKEFLKGWWAFGPGLKLLRLRLRVSDFMKGLAEGIYSWRLAMQGQSLKRT